jgi:MFS family permease
MLIVSLGILRETYRPLVLERKVKKLRKEAGDRPLAAALQHQHSGVAAVKTSLLRPFRLLVFSPIVLFPSLGLAVVFGMFFLMVSTMGVVFQVRYGFSPGSSGLAYLGFGAGLILANVVFAATSDRSYKAIASHGTPKPEIRLAPIALGAPLACIGLLMYGWGIDKQVHWILPIVGTAVFGMSIIAFVLPATTYLIEVFRDQAAAPVGASAVLRSLAGSLLPLCASRLYANLGLGWGNSLLAFLALVFAPLPWLFYRYGERLRERFPPKV